MSDESAKCKISRCAASLFSKFGLEGTSIRQIAKLSGLNLSLVSYYFGGKEGLYKAIFTEFAEQARVSLSEQLKKYDSETFSKEQFFMQMRGIIDQMIKMQVANPEIMMMMQRETLEGLPYAREVWEQTFHALGESIVGVLESARNQGLVRQDINLQVHFLSMVHAIDVMFISNRCKGPWEKKLFRLPEESKKVSEQIFIVFVEGISL